MSRLILSSHNLYIETGRWHRPHCIPREDRKCTTCNTIEDEYHFVIECSIFTDLRKRYISKYYWTNLSMYKLKQLFNCTNVSKLSKLSIYVLKTFELISNLLVCLLLIFAYVDSFINFLEIVAYFLFHT